MERTSSVVVQEGGAGDSLFDDDGRIKRTGGIQYMFCGLAQYATLIGLGIGYVITTALSIGAIERTNCYHKYGHDWPNCSPSTRNYIIEFGAVQMILSQVSNFHKLSFISMVAAIMSFTYSIIGIALSAVRIAGGTPVTTSVTGVPIDNNTSAVDKMWKTFSALGNIAIAFAFSIVDTLKASPRENRVMKQATFVGIMVSSFFYTLCGIVGYAAFGVDAPGNLLTDDHGFFEPYWLVDFANACKAVFTQPVFAFVERWSRRRWPESRFITAEYNILGFWEFSFFRLLWRTGYVIFTVIVGFIFPFFNAFVGLLGAISFWPLTIYFPTQMYMTQAKIRRFSFAWFCLQTLSLFCFIVSLLAAAGSVRNLIKYVIHYQPFDP
nr:amino acid permease 6-like [Ipomoea batatas]